MALKLPMVDLKSMYLNVLWVHCRVMNITVLNCQRNVAAAATAWCCRSRRLVSPLPPPVTSRGAGKTAGNFRQQQLLTFCVLTYNFQKLVI
jgi:hypothetical protein